MKTNSFMNEVMANSVSPDNTPHVGQGATHLGWTDRHAYTVIEVITPKHIRVQRDISTRVDSNGMSEAQEYEFTPNPNGHVEEIRLCKDGHWYSKGGMKNGRLFSVGYRDSYYDYSF
jgi:hypothetical protein